MQWYIKGDSTSFDLCSDISRESQQALIYAVIYYGRVNKLWFMQWYIKGESTSFDLCSYILRESQQALIYAMIY